MDHGDRPVSQAGGMHLNFERQAARISSGGAGDGGVVVVELPAQQGIPDAAPHQHGLMSGPLQGIQDFQRSDVPLEHMVPSLSFPWSESRGCAAEFNRFPVDLADIIITNFCGKSMARRDGA